MKDVTPAAPLNPPSIAAVQEPHIMPSIFTIVVACFGFGHRGAQLEASVERTVAPNPRASILSAEADHQRLTIDQIFRRSYISTISSADRITGLCVITARSASSETENDPRPSTSLKPAKGVIPVSYLAKNSNF